MLAYFNTSVSDGGLPPTVEEFTTKIMDKAFNAQEALHLVEAARLTVTAKKRSADSDDSLQTPNNQPSKRQNRALSAHPGSAVPSADQRSGPPPTCKGCGWITLGNVWCGRILTSTIRTTRGTCLRVDNATSTRRDSRSCHGRDLNWTRTLAGITSHLDLAPTSMVAIPNTRGVGSPTRDEVAAINEVWLTLLLHLLPKILIVTLVY